MRERDEDMKGINGSEKKREELQHGIHDVQCYRAHYVTC